MVVTLFGFFRTFYFFRQINIKVAIVHSGMRPGDSKGPRRPEESGQRRDLVLYATPEGARTVHSAVRAKILTCSVPGTSPSTRSSGCVAGPSPRSRPISSLLEDGISGEADPSDERKKIFYLASPRSGTFRPPSLQ